MFSLHDFILKTLKGMVDKYPDFQVREYALNWYAKGKLTEEDLQFIESELEERVRAEIEALKRIAEDAGIDLSRVEAEETEEAEEVEEIEE